MKKDWYKSKAIWASVCVAIGVLGSYLSGNIDITQAVIGIGEALGIFGIRMAQK